MSQERVDTARLLGQIETAWGYWDALFQDLDHAGWEQSHGEDWKFYDVPYHLAYCERDLVARPIEKGPDIQPDERMEIRTLRELNRWNDAQFDSRPPDQTVAQTLAEMEACRERVRRSLNGASDRDLDGLIWFPLTELRGWRSLRFLLQWSVLHNLSEFLVLRAYMGRDEPVASPALNRTAARIMMHRMPFEINRARIGDGPLTFSISLTDPGALSWSIRIHNGEVELLPDVDAAGGFSLRTSLASYYQMVEGMITPQEAHAAGQIEMDGQEPLEKFMALMAPRDPDVEIEPMPEGFFQP